VIAGAAQLFAQGGWAGFAGVAAMIALMAGLGFSGSGGGGQKIMPESMSTGTVLGDSTKSSESIKNVTEMMQDIHASEYPILVSIRDGISDMTTSINAAVEISFLLRQH